MNTYSIWSSRLSRVLRPALPFLVPAIPFLWLLALFVTPFLIVLKISLSEYAVSQPPYSPHFDWNDIPGFLNALSSENYVTLLGVPLSSFIPVFLITALTFLAGVPLAFFMATRQWIGKMLLAFFLVLPFVVYGTAIIMGKLGSPELLEWMKAYLFWNPEKPEIQIPPIYDWLLRIYALLCLVVFPITGLTGKLEKRHYKSGGVFSLKLAVNTLWRKGKSGLLLAVLGAFVGATAFMMQREFDGDPIYWEALLSSLRIAIIATVLLLIVGFPIAYAMAQAPKEWQPVLLAGVMLPFWIVFLIRIYSWKLILEPIGHFISQLGMALGLLSSPITLLNSEIAVFIGIVYGYLPFMVLPLYATLEKMDLRLVEAATDLGSPPWRTFWTITVPLAKPGIFAGSLLCFIPAVGEFVIPELLGGSDTLMIGKTLWSEFFYNRDWPLASSVAVILLIILVIPIMLFQRMERFEMDGDETGENP